MNESGTIDLFFAGGQDAIDVFLNVLIDMRQFYFVFDDVYGDDGTPDPNRVIVIPKDPSEIPDIIAVALRYGGTPTFTEQNPNNERPPAAPETHQDDWYVKPKFQDIVLGPYSNMHKAINLAKQRSKGLRKGKKPNPQVQELWYGHPSSGRLSQEYFEGRQVWPRFNPQPLGNPTCPKCHYFPPGHAPDCPSFVPLTYVGEKPFREAPDYYASAPSRPAKPKMQVHPMIVEDLVRHLKEAWLFKAVDGDTTVQLDSEKTVYVAVSFLVESYGPHTAWMYVHQPGYRERGEDHALSEANDMVEEYINSDQCEEYNELVKEKISNGESQEAAEQYAYEVLREPINFQTYVLSPEELKQAVEATAGDLHHDLTGYFEFVEPEEE